MANLFDKLRLVVGTSSLSPKASSEKADNESNTPGATGSASPASPSAGIAVAKPQSLPLVSESADTSQTGAKPAGSEETLPETIQQSTHHVVIPTKTVAKPKGVPKGSKLKKSSGSTSSATASAGGSGTAASVKKMKTKHRSDSPTAPPKKVAKTEKKKKPKASASRPPDLDSEDEEEAPRPKKPKSSRKSKPVDARPAFEPLTKPFVIPRRKMSKDVGLLQEVPLDSREYLKDIQPLVMKQYREVASRGRFLFTKAKIVHNEDLAREFQEQKKALKEEGRNDKDVAEHFAFYCVDTENEAIEICQNGIFTNTPLVKGGSTNCLGNSEMGVYLSRHSDIIQRGQMLNGQQGWLIVFKIMKGKVKAMPLNYTSVIEPTPNYDCHVAKDSDVDVLKLGAVRAFDHTQIYIYEYGDLDLEKRPKQICPYAVIQFVYKDPHKKQVERDPLASMGTVPQRSPAPILTVSPATTPSRQPATTPSRQPATTPSRQPATTPSRQSAATPSRQPPSSPIVTEPTKSTLDAKEYKAYSKHSYRLWKGNLECKGHKAFIGLMVSYASPIVPHIFPEKLKLRAEVPLHKLKTTLPVPIFKPGLPIITRQKEVVLDGKHYLYSELKQVRDKEAEENAKKAKKRSIDSLMKYMLQNGVALKIQLDSSMTLYLLPTSKFTDELGITVPGYPSVLHVLSISRVPTMTHVTSKGIHLPKEFRMESATNQQEQDHPNKMRDMRRTMLGFFSDQKTIAMGESQKTCRVEMAPEYRTSQSVYMASYTGTTGVGLLPTPGVRTRVPSGEQGHMQGSYPRQFHPGNLTIPMSPAHSESGSSQHSTSPLYEPESPHAFMDPRLKAHPAKRVGDPRDPRLSAVAYTSTSRDPRLARSMGTKVPSHPLVQQQVAKPPVADPRLNKGQVSSGDPDRYSHLQGSAVEYAQRKAAESQKKDAHRYHQHEKKRRGSERDVHRGVAKHHSKRQRHISEPDYREQVLLQLTQKTLQQLKTDPVVQEGTSQLLEFHGMMKQQQQVLELQKEMKKLRETRRISAEGLHKGSPTDLESAYQTKIGQLQKTLASLLQQRQKLASSEPSLDQPHQASSAKVSDLLTQVQSLGEPQMPPVASDPRMSAASDPRKAAPSDLRKKAPLDPRRVSSDPRRNVPPSSPRASLPSSSPQRMAPGDPRKVPVARTVLLRQLSDTSQTSDTDRVEVITKAPYEVVMEIESPDPEEQMADFNKAAAAGLQGQTKIIPQEDMTTPQPIQKPKDFGKALAVKDVSKKSHPEKAKKKRTPSGDKSKDASKATAIPEGTAQQKSAVEMLWEKAHQDESMTDASDDLYDPSNPTPTTPTNETVKEVVALEAESPVSPIREADAMKDFLNSNVETPVREVVSDTSSSPAVSLKGKSSAEKTKTAVGKPKPAVEKTKTTAEKTKTTAGKTKAPTEKTKTSADKTKTPAEKTKTAVEKTKTAAEKPSAAAQKKIKSAKDMSSYLNKQLQELEKEKQVRNKKKKASKGKDVEEDPQTIEEIDALIMKLHKLKNAKLKEEEQKKQKKKPPPPKPKAKVKASKDDGKENTRPGKKPPGPRDPVCGEAPLTRHWGQNAGPVHGIILGPGPNRTKLNLGQLDQQTEDKRKVKMSIDGKKMNVEVTVNAKDVKRKKEGLDSSAESCVLYMMHRRFHVESKGSENTDDRNFIDSVLEAVHGLVALQEIGCNKERQRKVVETAVKLEKRKQQSEERMSLESGEEEEDGEIVVENMYDDLDDAQGVSIKLNEDGTQKDPDRIWFVGSSVITRAASAFANRPGGTSLGLTPKAEIKWLGITSEKINDCVANVRKHLADDLPPSIIVFHLGPFSLNDYTLPEIRQAIKVLISSITDDMPYCRLIWSDVLPQQHYPGSIKFEEVDRARILLNRFCRRLCLNSLGGAIIKYPQIKWQNRTLYEFGGVYLSKAGENMFVDHLECAIKVFLADPLVQVYPESVQPMALA